MAQSLRARRTAPRVDLVGIYLNDHLAAATGGLELFKRAAHSLHGTPVGAAVERMAVEISEDRETLQEVMRSLGVPQRQYKVYAAWAAEKAGRLKPNGHLRSRSPLSTLVELEAMLVGVEAKSALWRTLEALAQTDTRLDGGRFAALQDRARQQANTLEDLRVQSAAEVFAAT
jgi:hypothetical protein